MGELLKMKQISIAFPGVKALNKAEFSALPGRAHALVGANGAGKSTLMKVLSGAHSHYEGEIWLEGKPVDIRSPKDAQTNGIQIVHQEVDTALIPSLSVGENVMLNETVQNMGKKQWMKWGSLYKRAAAILQEMNIRVSPKKLVQELTLAEKQMVLIARAVSTHCKLLILDEPTAALSYTETKELFRVVEELKERGVSIIFISHRFPEIYSVCEDITIMRNGETVAAGTTDLISQNEAVEKMLGAKLDEQFPSLDSKFGGKVLEVDGLSDSEKVQEAALYVRQGEIVGLAGLVGAGKTELCKVLFGESRQTSGEIRLHGKPCRLKSPYQAVKNGMALVPEERRKEGILVHESVAVNLTAASVENFSNAFQFISRKAERKKAKEWIQSLGIKTPSEEGRVEHLSGGNQQKVAIGKWLIADADVYLFDEPTKGVDIGAKKDIFELIAELAKNGKAVLYASSELSEIIGITHRTYVLYDGRTVAELETAKTNEEELLYYSTGGRNDEHEQSGNPSTIQEKII
ncbi:sugar ABC transporter ATP-binding protein [Bacillus massiliglaciei]|uniref:sugar ABC transporter ATP-binding protein n=1 Tax=Bacillus massiliglaciei TaxID=1816693 RepID=UPI000AFA04EA|nr:sugar ABC transporter ATP-binding protein [Bacillus massiliglaciei]